MTTNLLQKLLDNGILQYGIWETIYMTLLSTIFAYVIGLPIGLILSVTGKNGIRPIAWLNRILGIIVNIFRSIPFIILMVAMLPVAKFIVGSSLGNKAMIVTLVIAAAPYVARMVESSIAEVGGGVIEAVSYTHLDVYKRQVYRIFQPVLYFLNDRFNFVLSIIFIRTVGCYSYITAACLGICCDCRIGLCIDKIYQFGLKITLSGSALSYHHRIYGVIGK